MTTCRRTTSIQRKMAECQFLLSILVHSRNGRSLPVSVFPEDILIPTQLLRGYCAFDSKLCFNSLSYWNPTSNYQISPAASPEILHHKVRKTWLFIPYRWEIVILPILTTTTHFSLKRWENVLYEPRSGKVKIGCGSVCTCREDRSLRSSRHV